MVNFFAGLIGCASVFASCYFAVLIAVTAFNNLKSIFSKRSPTKTAYTEPSPLPVKHVYEINSPNKRKRNPPKSNVISLKGALLPVGTVVYYNGKQYTLKKKSSAKNTKCKSTKISTTTSKVNPDGGKPTTLISATAKASRAKTKSGIVGTRSSYKATLKNR